MFEAWNVAKGCKVQGGWILSQGTVYIYIFKTRRISYRFKLSEWKQKNVSQKSQYQTNTTIRIGSEANIGKILKYIFMYINKKSLDIIVYVICILATASCPNQRWHEGGSRQCCQTVMRLLIT
jgi:hypothetical protein